MVSLKEFTVLTASRFLSIQSWTHSHLLPQPPPMLVFSGLPLIFPGVRHSFFFNPSVIFDPTENSDSDTIPYLNFRIWFTHLFLLLLFFSILYTKDRLRIKYYFSVYHKFKLKSYCSKTFLNSTPIKQSAYLTFLFGYPLSISFKLTGSKLS